MLGKLGSGVRNSSFVVHTLVQCVVEVFVVEKTETDSFSFGFESAFVA